MAVVLLPGRNRLSLCPEALCRIVEQHLRDACYTSKESIHVTSVGAVSEHGSTVFTFSVTSDQTEQKKEPGHG